MVFTVRCFECGRKDARVIMGGRSIIHARCHACGTNLLDEVMTFEQQVTGGQDKAPPPDEPARESAHTADRSQMSKEGLDEGSSSTSEDSEDQALRQS